MFFVVFSFVINTNSVRSVTQKYLEKIGEVTFDKIFNQRLGKEFTSEFIYMMTNTFIYLGFLLFKQYCEEISDEPIPQLGFYEEVNHNSTDVFLFLKRNDFFFFFIILLSHNTRCHNRRCATLYCNAPDIGSVRMLRNICSAIQDEKKSGMKNAHPQKKFCGGGLHVIHSDNFSLLLIYVDLLIPLVDYVMFWGLLCRLPLFLSIFLFRVEASPRGSL